MSLRKRIEKLEEWRASEPELASGLTAQEAYFAILHRRGVISEEDPAKPGFYRLIKTPPRAPGPTLDELLGRPPTPEEAYGLMTGKLDVKTLVAKR